MFCKEHIVDIFNTNNIFHSDLHNRISNTLIYYRKRQADMNERLLPFNIHVDDYEKR